MVQSSRADLSNPNLKRRELRISETKVFNYKI